jgi:hypothetical protein
MRKGSLATWGCALIAAVAVAVPAKADIIAYWNFNMTSGSLYSWSADMGSGTLTLDPAWTQLSVTTGTTTNAEGPDPAGDALGLRSNANNGLTMDFVVDTTGYEDIILSFAATRNNQGFDEDAVLYSTDGVNYTQFSTFNPSNGSWGTVIADMSAVAAVEDAGTIYLRLKFDSAQNNNGTTTLDNVRIIGTVIPTPGAVALFGMAGLVAVRRRRR